MRDNIIEATYNTKGRFHTDPVYQYDYGLILRITDVELPSTYEVHFSNSIHGKAVTQIGDSNGVAVPDMLLLKGLTVYAWLFLHTGDSDGETEFLITIPVIQRAKPEDIEVTVADRTAVTAAIEALNAATAKIQQYEQRISDLEAGKFKTDALIWNTSPGTWGVVVTKESMSALLDMLPPIPVPPI